MSSQAISELEVRRSLAPRLLLAHGSEAVSAIAAAQLGLGRDELRRELKVGRSLAEIAGDRGESVDVLCAALVAPLVELAESLPEERRADLLAELDEDARRLVEVALPVPV
jgi:hypothetical protein